jgi:hypothetical protein
MTAGFLRWRDRGITHRIVHKLYVLGVISGSGATTNGRYQTEHGWRLTFVSFHGRRPYVLGLEREAWGYPWHLLRYRHWPEMVWGCCGKCAPWPCCGATGYEHAEGCGDDA